eukprot:CAMPEP_0167802286 /NCGR_PEP_ID=MMETSP0111_2-20121227/19033_1 /TAXON_ID=91324 /ORGANISM="Lotharella globosa, Strain CCCM811" /LENGTH=35 /DNA_ID= /DNA_START= /DNA_END= /DNA_ORIENTATION=
MHHAPQGIRRCHVTPAPCGPPEPSRHQVMPCRAPA